jgi:hypothetical protein
MGKAYNTILRLHKDFEDLRTVLKGFLSEKELLKQNILVKSGLILRRYVLRFDKINTANLDNLRNELRKAAAIENDVRYNIRNIRQELKKVEKAYFAYFDERLHINQIFTRYMNDCFYLSRLMANQTESLARLTGEGAKIHKKASPPKVLRLLESLEKTGNQILKFIDLLEQITRKIGGFEKKKSYASERMYGRVMSRKEYKKTRAKGELIGSPAREEGELIGVFDCSSSALANRISSMSEDELKDFFGKVGVVGGVKVIFFRTKLIPSAGPIPMSNGLKEYKFPKGIPVDIAA